jgi:hypothetical protein
MNGWVIFGIVAAAVIGVVVLLAVRLGPDIMRYRRMGKM